MLCSAVVKILSVSLYVFMDMSFRRTLIHLGTLRHVGGRRSLASAALNGQRPDHVRIVEVGPRDGLQNEKQSIPLETKIELVKRLAATGLQNIEAGSFVSPKWVPQVR